MLGEAQWAWLEASLRRPAQLRLLVSSVQLLDTGHAWECWAQLPRERRRLLRLLGDLQAATGPAEQRAASSEQHAACSEQHAACSGAGMLRGVPLCGAVLAHTLGAAQRRR